MMNSYCSHNPKTLSDSSLTKSDEDLKIPKSSPSVFGPPTWAYLHLSTAHLPENLNPVVAEQVKNTLRAIPLMVPCDACSLHSGNFMVSNKDRIDTLKTGSDFFKFTVDLHNFVNKRLNKKLVSYEDALAMWK